MIYDCSMMKRYLLIIGGLLMFLAACTPNPPSVQPPTSSPSSTHSATATVEPTLTLTLTPTLTPTETLVPTPAADFSFVVTSDMSHYSAQKYLQYPNFFAGLLGYVKQYGPGDFMVSTGDVLPAADTRWTIGQVLGEDYLWYPMPGNHDFGLADLRFLQNYNYDPNGDLPPNIVNSGPESCPRTTYSFDYQNSHFVALNVYCDEEAPWGIDGSITDPVYNWLAEDLAGTDKEHLFVFGHEPAYPQPDAQTGDLRHDMESLDQYPAERDRFWELLQEYNVVAYIHGHTHGYSAVKMDGIWQLDAGQAMGVRAAPSPGTFLIITVQGEQVALKTYRGESGPGFSFQLWEEINLRP